METGRGSVLMSPGGQFSCRQGVSFPCRLTGTTVQSGRWNLQVADERGAVLSRYLVLEDGGDFSLDACRVGHEREDWQPYPAAKLIAEANYNVTRVPSAQSTVPVDDGDYPHPRRFGAEMLNRTAHIVFRNDACLVGTRNLGVAAAEVDLAP